MKRSSSSHETHASPRTKKNLEKESASTLTLELFWSAVNRLLSGSRKLKNANKKEMS